MLPIFCSGCSVVNIVSEDVFDSLKDFRDTEVPKLVKYIEEDQNLSERDKNTFRIKLRQYDDILKSIKVKSKSGTEFDQ